MNAEPIYTTETITPALAQMYLEHCNTHNRPITSSTVDFYAEQMSKGNWVLNGESITFDVNNVLTNGQHRLLAVIKAGIPIKFTVMRNADAKAFLATDQGMNRKASDIFAIEDIPNYCTVSAIVRRYSSMCSSKENIIKDKGIAARGRAKLSHIDMLDAYNEHGELFQECFKIASKCVSSCKLINRASIGAIIAYLNLAKGYDIKFIEEFFYILHQYNKDREFYPCKIIRDRIIKAALNHQRLSNRYINNMLVKAWEYWVKGIDSKKLTASEEENLTFN